MQLPSVGPGGKRQVRSWPVVPLCDAGGPTLQQKLVLKPASFKVPDRSLETIRLQIPQAFLDDATWRLLASSLVTLPNVPWDLCTLLEFGNKFRQVLVTNGTTRDPLHLRFGAGIGQVSRKNSQAARATQDCRLAFRRDSSTALKHNLLGVPDVYPEAGLLMRWQLRSRMWASLSMT